MELYFPLILDGATGTQLQKRGYTGSECAESWTLTHPEAITDIHRRYAEAGSHIVYAPTFGANRVKLEENGIFNRVADYNHRLAAIAKASSDGQTLIAGDIAPTGKFLAPLGDVSFEELVEIYTEQAQALEEAGVDLFVIETMMTVPEARAAVLAVKSVSQKPILVTFTCDEKGRTLTGTDVTAALVILQGMGIAAFGLNCSVGPEEMLVQLKRLSAYAEVPLIAKPNAGMPKIVDGRTVYELDPAVFAASVPAFAEAGVGVYGGCCGTTEAHIAAIAEAVQKVSYRKPAPTHSQDMVLATEKEVFVLSPAAETGPVIDCDEHLGEAIAEAAEKALPVLSVRITKAGQLEDFADHQYAIDRPLCLCCDDADLLEEALKRYQGRAMVESSLGEDVLEKLSRSYGIYY